MAFVKCLLQHDMFVFCTCILFSKFFFFWHMYAFNCSRFIYLTKTMFLHVQTQTETGLLIKYPPKKLNIIWGNDSRYWRLPAE